MQKQITHVTTEDEILDALGGNKGVGALIGKSPPLVSNLRKSGISRKYHFLFLRLLEERGITGGRDVFDGHYPELKKGEGR